VRIALAGLVLGALASSVAGQTIEVVPRRDVILSDRAHFHARLNPIGGLQVDQPFRLVGVPFEGATVDSNFWAAIANGAASAAGQANSIATVTSGTANSGYGQISTTQKARFMSAHPHMFRGAIRIPDTTEAAVTRRWGSFSVSTVAPQDGVYFEVSAAGVLSVVTVTGATPTAVASGSFNGDVESWTLDTDVHAYEIVHFTMGAWYFIDNILIHEVIPTTAPLAATLSVPATITAVNGAGGTESGSVEVWNVVVNRLGRAVTQSTSYHHAVGTTAGVILKRGPGQLHSIQLHSITNNSVMTIYDNTAASGTVLWSSGSLPAIATPFDVLMRIPFQIGLTLVVATQNLGAVVAYE